MHYLFIYAFIYLFSKFVRPFQCTSDKLIQTNPFNFYHLVLFHVSKSFKLS